MRLYPYLLAAFTLAATPAQLAAQTLAQKQMMAKQDADFAAAVPDTDTACGTSLKAAIDWPSFLKAAPAQYSISGFCAEALSSMRGMCADPLAKQAIADKVKTYTCALGGAGKRALSLDNGALRMDIDWDAANYDDFIRGWLGDHL